jgi:hypothetical protein
MLRSPNAQLLTRHGENTNINDMEVIMDRRALAGVLPAALIALFIPGTRAQSQQDSIRYPANKILAHALAVEIGSEAPRPHEAPVSSGTMYAVLAASGELNRRVNASSTRGDLIDFSRNLFTQGCSNVFRNGERTNIRINQDCSLRRQAEEVIVVNPTNPENLIAGQNDSRIGFNHCGYDFSFDGGRTWGDMVPPFYNFTLGDGHVADACSDPTATFDSRGNAYVAGLLFEVSGAPSAIVVMKSNAGIGGAFYHSPAPIPFQAFNDTPVGVVTSDTDPGVSNDKEFIVADSHAGSRKRDNVYATWTRFTQTDSPIFFSQSTDGGATWSTGIEISGASSTCKAGSGQPDPNACDQDQGSDPVVGPDGTVYVTFGNSNTSGTTNQVLIVSCAPTADCSTSSGWTAPVKVGDLVDTQPVGPSAAGCSRGRSCLPPNGYRMEDLVTISVSVDHHSTVYVTWSDFRNGKPNCQGAAATATPPCDNDVFYAYSLDRGATWSKATQLTPAGSAQWQPWSAVSPDGSVLWVAYYDRSYGNCEQTGCNDITLAGVHRPASPNPWITHRRVTTASMPNLTPANNPVEAGFLGDYMWVSVDGWGRPHIVWSDTRGLNGAVEEDVYFSRMEDRD